MDLKTTAEMLVDLADKKGAAASDVLVASGQSFSGGVRLGDVEKIENSQEKRLGLRLFVGESSAISSTSPLRFNRNNDGPTYPRSNSSWS